jgi:hypothetical protein
MSLMTNAVVAVLIDAGGNSISDDAGGCLALVTEAAAKGTGA